jgi:CHAD domain-containing protein
MNRSLPLARLLDRRARALRRHLAAAVAGKERGVHQARVASRRLREALPVLTEGLHHSKRGKADRKVRRLTAALGGVRELDVTLQLIDEVSDRAGAPRTALAEVRAQVIEDRERRRTTMLKRLDQVDTGKLDRRLQAVKESVLEAPAQHAWRAVLAVRVARRARRLARAIENAGQVYAAQPLHEVRIAAKKLRYALELADETGAAPCIKAVRVLKRVQDQLGRLHDLQILQHYAAAVGAAPRRRRGTPDLALAQLTRLIEDECRHLHARYVAMVPALAEVIDLARRDVPARLTARRPARAVKMTLPARRRAAGGRA